jgi:hypothetical protein
MAQAETYNEATVMWRLRHPDGRSAHAVIVPTGSTASAFWFMLSTPQASLDFNDWRDALAWATEVRARLYLDGWTDWEQPNVTWPSNERSKH